METGPATAPAAALAEALIAALRGLEGLNGCYDGAATQAAFPHGVLEMGAELDWGHKTGAGREITFSLVLRDEGEAPARLRRIEARARDIVTGLGGVAGWDVVTLIVLRGRIAGEGRRRWIARTDYRARMLAR